jgi:hypothetical protein
VQSRPCRRLSWATQNVKLKTFISGCIALFLDMISMLLMGELIQPLSYSGKSTQPSAAHLKVGQNALIWVGYNSFYLRNLANVFRHYE